MGQDRLLGRRDRRLDQGACTHTCPCTPHGAALLVPAPASEADFRLLGRAKCNPVQPVTQQVGILDRAGLASQHEEHRLKDVFGKVEVTYELSADVQDHRSMPRHQGGERRFPGRIAPTVESLQELSVGESSDRCTLKE
jgi:hypothetical protein